MANLGFYTYAHYRADNNSLFYIGKGSGKRYLKKENRNRHWRNIVNKAGGFNAEILNIFDSEKDALCHEEFLISTFRGIDVSLANVCSGGKSNSGPRHTDESKKKLSDAHKGKKPSELALKKLKESLIGVPKSKKHRENLSIAKSGIKVPNAWKPVFCKTNKKRYQSIGEAAQILCVDKSHIVKCCKGKINATKGYSFEYVE